MEKKIFVKKEHVENAIKRSSQHCMIADAIQQQIPDAKYILVDLQSIRFTLKDKKKRYTFLTPPVCQEKIIQFDRGEKPCGFIFTLHHPTRIKKMNTNRTGGPKRKSRKGPQRPKRDKLRVVREFGVRMYRK
jgi:hypothetical protein